MARKLPIPNGRLDGALDANSQRIVHLVGPLSGDDAATKSYVDARDAASADELRKQVAASVGTKQDKLDSRQLAAVNSGVTEEKLANLVAKDDVVPVGTGTEVVARIGGKEIRAPAGGGGGGAVASVNGMKGVVYLGANDVGALPTSGGLLIDESKDTTFLAIGGVKAGLRERSYAGELVVSSKFDLETGEVLVPASIKKDRNEVATEKYVDTAKRDLSARIDRVEATSHTNINVVGSPSFSQGSVSGFSANDYLVSPTEVNVGQNTVDFYMSFTTGADVTTQQNLLDSWCGLAFAIQNGRAITAASSNGTTFFTLESYDQVFEPNSSYRLRLRFEYLLYPDGMEYILRTYLASGSGEYEEISPELIIGGPLHPTATYWGGANPQSGVHHIFGGTINLNECRMVWNGTEVWRGYDELPTVKFDPTANPRLDTAEKIAAQSAYPIVYISGSQALDRTINVYPALTVAPVAILVTFPARTGALARDFVVRVPASTVPHSITFPANVDYETDQDDCWTYDVGKSNEWYFSESEPGLFKVMHKAFSPVTQ